MESISENVAHQHRLTPLVQQLCSEQELLMLLPSILVHELIHHS